MAEEDNKNNQNSKTLTVKPGTLGLKKPLAGKVGPAQHAPGSRSGVVVVTRKGGMKPGRSKQSADLGSDGLTHEERERRLLVLKEAEMSRKLEEERIKQQQEEAKKEEEIRQQALVEAAAQEDMTRKEEEEKLKVENEKQKSETIEHAKRQSEEIKTLILNRGKVRNLNTKSKTEVEVVAEAATAVEPKVEEKKDQHKAKAAEPVKPQFANKKKDVDDEVEKAAPAKVREDDKKASRKLSLTQLMMMEQEEIRRGRSLASIKRAKEKAKRKFSSDVSKEKILREVQLPDFITVQELASRMSEKAADVIKELMKMGIMVTLNQSIDADTAELVITEFGHKVKRITAQDVEKSLLQEVDDVESDLLPRSPVVTIMGHVDHGKTSLLDALRQTDVAAGEAGGITQHIGAYQVTLKNGAHITFLDTPGHEAFTAMRARGAKVTDIVVLVVAADDGIMQQTIEAISHAKAANVPIIVAVNKIDKPNADPGRVKNELLIHGLVPEDMGGETIVVEVSARMHTNLDKLEENILLQAEILNLRANPRRIAKGIVVEAKMDKGRGVVATLLVQKGTLNFGDIVVAGKAYGKVRALLNDKGKKIESAGPSLPIEILGLNETPVAGDEFLVASNEKAARDIVEFRINQEKERMLVTSRKANLETMFLRAKSTNFKEFNMIVKADVQGSAEAIVNSLMKLSNEEIEVRILYSGVGAITESDITLATASDAFIVGFNVRANNQAKDLAKRNGVEIRYYSIIYNLVDEVKSAMSGMLSPNIREEILGYLDVKQVFNLSKFGMIAGCYVTEGMVKRHCHVRLLRDNIVIHDGRVKALKRFKDDIKEAKVGFECGLSFENWEDIKVGDRIEAYELIEEKRTL
jgi:translation initiation factor IF-2